MTYMYHSLFSEYYGSEPVVVEEEKGNVPEEVEISKSLYSTLSSKIKGRMYTTYGCYGLAPGTLLTFNAYICIHILCIYNVQWYSGV